MYEFLEILKRADGDYWDTFLEKAKEIHNEKFTLSKCEWKDMSVYQIYKNGWNTHYKDKATGITS